eukprot:Platyproteum_vivax@DN2902_c0_g1_i1.p1
MKLKTTELEDALISLALRYPFVWVLHRVDLVARGNTNKKIVAIRRNFEPSTEEYLKRLGSRGHPQQIKSSYSWMSDDGRRNSIEKLPQIRSPKSKSRMNLRLSKTYSNTIKNSGSRKLREVELFKDLSKRPYAFELNAKKKQQEFLDWEKAWSDAIKDPAYLDEKVDEAKVKDAFKRVQSTPELASMNRKITEDFDIENVSPTIRPALVHRNSFKPHSLVPVHSGGGTGVWSSLVESLWDDRTFALPVSLNDFQIALADLQRLPAESFKHLFTAFKEYTLKVS